MPEEVKKRATKYLLTRSPHTSTFSSQQPLLYRQRTWTPKINTELGFYFIVVFSKFIFLYSQDPLFTKGLQHTISSEFSPTVNQSSCAFEVTVALPKCSLAFHGEAQSPLATSPFALYIGPGSKQLSPCFSVTDASAHYTSSGCSYIVSSLLFILRFMAVFTCDY